MKRFAYVIFSRPTSGQEQEYNRWYTDQHLGDVLRVPEQSNLVLVSGEVLFPNALVFDRQAAVDDYVSRAGGYNQGADRARIVVVRQDGSVTEARQANLRPGDEIMVLPKIETKNIEITRGITQIVYQIAVAAKVLFGL